MAAPETFAPPRPPAADGLPPQSREAEVAVLGSMLVEKESLLKALDILREEDFYEDTHRLIFAAVRALHDRNVTADVVTVGDELEKQGRLPAANGRAKLFELTTFVPSALHVEHYARIVREKSLLRQMIAIAREVASDSSAPVEEAQTLLDQAQQKFFTLAQDRATRGMVPASVLMQTAISTLEKLAESSKYVTGVSTGFSEFDKMTSGLQPSNLVIIAGRPSMGKTAFCLNVAEHVAIKEKRPVVFFSLEMSEQEIGLRLLCSQARINVRSVREGFLARKSWPTITNVASQIASAPLYFDFSTSPSILDIRGSARRWAHELKQKGNPLSLIIIDYIQLLHGGGPQESRQQEISEISRSIKALARELQVPVIALSQLNRRPEDRGREGRPQLSDLRECATGDTLVQLADGRQVPLATLVGLTPDVVSVSPFGNLVSARAEKIWQVGRRPIFRVCLSSGRFVKVTGEHRLLTFDGWRRVAHIRTGERLAIPRIRPMKLSLVELLESYPDKTTQVSPPPFMGGRISQTHHLKDGPRRVSTLTKPLRVARVDGDLFWDKVTGVIPAGIADVYDLTVPGPASWIGNGIVSHNSGALEQDADVVAAIFREEVYKRDDPDLKGKARLFVLKQRNGPIGDIDLNFISEFTKFADPAQEGE